MDPSLHERVYWGIKEDYLAGHFVPGKRIDIQELATRYRSSKTPVREAAFILVGEGLFTHHADGGFLVPLLQPEEVIDLIGWHMRLMSVALSTLRASSIRSALQQSLALTAKPSPVSVANLATGIFTSLIGATGNRQAVMEVQRLNERLHYSRIIDVNDPRTAEKELATIASVDAANLQKATRRRIEAYHSRKIDRQRTIIQTRLDEK